MNRIASFAIIASLSAFTQVGCSQETTDDSQSITGRIDGASLATQSLGFKDAFDVTKGDKSAAATDDGVSAVHGDKSAAVSGSQNSGNAQLHVVAHKLGTKQGEARDVDAVVQADGSFDLKLERGARYVFEIERGKDSVAFIGWNSKVASGKTTVLGISATTKGKGAVSLGKVKIVGNGAAVEHCLCDSFDERDTAGIDLSAKWFASAKGAWMTYNDALDAAKDALRQAEEALARADEALDRANDAISDSNDAIEKAKAAAAAGAAAGSVPDGHED